MVPNTIESCLTTSSFCDIEMIGIAGLNFAARRAVDPEDVEMLEDLVMAAANQALEKSKEMSQEEMQKIAGGMLGGMKIPGLT